MHRIHFARFARTMLLAGTAALLVSGAAFAQGDSDFDPWAPGAQWLTLRAGYAKSNVENSGNGGPGYGISYSRMISGIDVLGLKLFQHYSIGASVNHDLVGHFGPAAEIDVPLTVEMTRHYAWNTALHPYWGFGTGGYYRKTYRTGADTRDVSLGYFLALGANMPVAERNMLGLDIRMNRFEATNDPVNPVFGPGSGSLEQDGSVKKDTGTHWGAKLTWSFVY